MAEQGYSYLKKRNSNRWFKAIVAVILTINLLSPVYAQSGGTTGAPVQAPEPAPTAQETGTDREGTTPATTETESRRESRDSVGDSSEVPSLRVRRTRPEHPVYFTAQYSLRYSDNILLSTERKISDFVSTPLVGFGAVRVRPKSLVRIDYFGGGDIYHRLSNLNGMIHSLDFGYEKDISKRTTVFFRDTLLHRPQTAGFGLLGEGISTLSILSPSKSTYNNITAGFTHMTGRYSFLRGSYNYLLTRFSESTLIDSNEQVFDFGYNRQFSKTKTFDIGYRGSFLSGDGNVSTHSILPSLFYRKRNIRVRLGAGPQYVISNRNRLFLAAVAEIGYTKNRTVYTANYTQGVGSGGGAAVATRNQALFGSVTHPFGKLQSEFRIGYSRSTGGLDLATSPLVSSTFTNREIFFETYISYPIADKYSVFFEYTHASQRGSGSFENRTRRNQFSLGVNFDTRRTDRAPFTRPARF